VRGPASLAVAAALTLCARVCAGIEAQIARLAELEELQEEWQIQAEAQDEVERLLRSTDASGL
jgi:hypothetical protein